MFGTLREWEHYFADKIQSGEWPKGTPHAPLLAVVPDRIGWDAYLACVRDEWATWKNQLSAHQACLLTRCD